MKNFVQEGNTVTLTAPHDVASGEAALIGDLFGVSLHTLTAGQRGSFRLDGVFKLPKTTGAGTGVAEGGKLFWNDTAKKVTPASSGNKLIGAALHAADTAATEVEARLNGITTS